MADLTAPQGGKFRILVIEDDPAVARLILVNLAKAGLDCRYAPDGVAGLVAFQETKPHLVLLDIMMPGMNGRDVCARIRETSTVPIIMLTAVTGDENQVQGFKIGADDYVTKPFTPQALIARVVAHLRRAYRYDMPDDDEE